MAALLLLFFGLLLGWPVFQVLEAGFFRRDGRFTFAFVRLIFADPMLVRGLLNALVVAISVTLLTFGLSLPLAILGARYSFPGKSILSSLLLVPLILPPFVGAIGMKMVLGRYGPLSRLVGAGPLGIDWIGRYRMVGMLAVEVLHLYPIMLLNLQSALANIDPAMEQAAANLGARALDDLPTNYAAADSARALSQDARWCDLELHRAGHAADVRLLHDYAGAGVQAGAGGRIQSAALRVGGRHAGRVVAESTLSGKWYWAGRSTRRREKRHASAATNLTGAVEVAPRPGRFAACSSPAVVPHVAVVLTSLSTTGTWYKSVIPADFTSAILWTRCVNQLAFPERHSIDANTLPRLPRLPSSSGLPRLLSSSAASCALPG